MKQKIYTSNCTTIFGQTFLIWLSVLYQLVANALTILHTPPPSLYFSLLLLNGVLGCVNVPQVCLFINYYKHSKGKQLAITPDSVLLLNAGTQKSSQMKANEITQVEFVMPPQGWRLPWQDFEYACFTDINNNTIVVTSFMINSKNLQKFPFIKKIGRGKPALIEKIYPFIKN